MPTLDAAGDEGLLQDVKDDTQRLNRFKRWFDQSHRANEEWRAIAIESRRFVSGDQWSDADRNRLSTAQRPFLTINKILPRVLFLTGLQRSQRTEPKILPFEGGDARRAELMAALYKWFGAKTREPVVDSSVFSHKIIDGLGFWKVTWRYDGELEGNLCLESCDPLAIFPDPNWLDAGGDFDAAEYVQQATWMSLPEAIDQWPEAEDEIRLNYGEWLSQTTSSSQQEFGAGEFAGDSFSTDRPYWDPQTQRLRVIETWYKKKISVQMVMKKDTGESSGDPARVKAIRAAVQGDPSLAAAFDFFRVPVTKICLAHFTSDVLLDDDVSPYKPQVFPIFPTVAYYWWKTPFGIVEPLKDLQREKNRRRSTMIEMVQRSALAGWLNPEAGGARKEDLEAYASGIGKVIPFKQNPPVQIPAPELPQSLVYLDTSADRDMDSVSNIHAELLGTTTQRTVSGRAIKARQQSGLIVQEPLLESFKQDKEPAVRFAIELIQQFTSAPRALRVLGSIAVRDPQGQAGQMLNSMALQEIQDLLTSAFDECYDVVISTQPYDPSLKQQQADALMEIAQQFPDYTPPDVLIDAAKDAGVLTEDQAVRFKAFVEQKLQMQAQGQAAAAAGHAPAPPAPPSLAAAG